MTTNHLQAVNVNKPDAAVIGLLEGLLEQARTGEVIGVAIATVNREKIVSTAFMGDLDDSKVYYAATVLRLRIEDRIRESE